MPQFSDSKHRSESTTEEICLLMRSSQSAAFNPIKMFSHELRRVIHSRQPNNIAGVQQFFGKRKGIKFILTLDYIWNRLFLALPINH